MIVVVTKRAAYGFSVSRRTVRVMSLFILRVSVLSGASSSCSVMFETTWSFRTRLGAYVLNRGPFS